MPDSEPDDSERIDRLERIVAEQQATIQKLMPSRRQTIAGLGLLGAGGVAGRLSTDRARAQAAGAVGSDDKPVDVTAWDLDVQNGATFNGTDVTGVGAMEVEDLSIATDQTLLSGGTLIPIAGAQTTSVSETSSTEFTDIGVLNGGGVDPTEVPSGATIYGRVVAQLDTPAGEDAIRVQPVYYGENHTFPTLRFSELEVSADADNDNVDVDTGWVEITTFDDRFAYPRRVDGEVDGGTGGIQTFGNDNRYGVNFAWRINQ